MLYKPTEHMPGASYVELPGEEALSCGDAAVLDEIEEFLTGARASSDTERILSTVMFSDIVDSTQRAAETTSNGKVAAISVWVSSSSG